MSIRKTLGGDRLGSGKKMKVDLHGYERSTHDLGYLWRSTMAAGTLVPFMHEIALPGDTFDINLGCDVKTHPTIGPLFGSFKVQLDVFLTPLRLYNSLMHNNMLGIGNDMSRVKLPKLTLQSLATDASEVDDIDNCQINPSCILKYLGISGVGFSATEDTSRSFNGVGLLEYWDIYKNYYSNKQEEVGAVLHTILPITNETVTSFKVSGEVITIYPTLTGIYCDSVTDCVIEYTGAVPYLDSIYIITDAGNIFLSELAKDTDYSGTGFIYFKLDLSKLGVGSTIVKAWRYRNQNDLYQGMPDVTFFNLSNIDDMRKAILAWNSEASAFDIGSQGITPYFWPASVNLPQGYYNSNMSQEGLALKTYQSDLFNNWLQTEWIDDINAISAIDTSSGEFTIDALNLSKKVYELLNRIAASGGTYDDWIDAVYVHDRYKRAETPMYMGGLSKELVFQEVISNAQSTEQPLGTLGGRGIMANKHKGGEIIIKVDEPCYIMGIVSLTPRIDYSQGNKWDVHLQTMNDLHKPHLDEIGFQDLMTEQLAWWNTQWEAGSNVWQTFAVGKQPAWINYMTNVNRTFGNFAIADNEMFMTLNRRYERNIDGSIDDLTTYIDPAKFNHIFAETSRDAQNFWVQIACDITARRKMSAKVMPNL